jgi:hypothetical protein
VVKPEWHFPWLCRWSLRFLVGVIMVSAGIGLLRGDGKVFPTALIAGEVSIPDQRAILCWANGEERLVIETRFEGEGTHFAWVMPLPAVPRIEPATTGVFRTLEHLTRPELRHDLTPVWRWIVVLGALVWLGATVRATGRVEVGDVVAATVVTVGLGAGGWGRVILALVPALILLLVVALFRRGQFRWGVSVAFLSLFFGFFLAGFGGARSKAGSEGSATVNPVEVILRQQAGVYEIEVISANDPQALPGWLRENGYALTPGSEPILEQYASDGWVFAAAKVRRDHELGSSTPHPLSFTFAAREPIYPLRLTGSAGEPLDVELYVFGHERATATGFSVRECRPLRFTPLASDYAFGARRGVMRHPLLLSWTTNLTVMTKLSGRLSPQELQSDAVIEWRPTREAGTTVYSTSGARTTALNYGTAVAAWGLIMVLIGRGFWKIALRGWRMAAAALLLGIVVGGITFAVLPVVEVRLETLPGIMSHNSLYQARIEAEGLLADQPEPDLAELRRDLATLVATGYPNTWNTSTRGTVTFPNPFSGTAMREEDSPGNYVIREREGRIEFVAYDAEGGETVMVLDQ